jgi:DNA-binding transcriptional LysR family regulator
VGDGAPRRRRDHPHVERRRDARAPRQRAVRRREGRDRSDDPRARGASAGYRSFLTALCREAGFEPSIAFEPGDLWTGRGIIAAGLAVGLLPRLAFTIPHPGVAIRPLAGSSPARTILAVHISGRGVPAVAPMLECVAEAFASL